ncbi:ChaN family lipoprotein [bacterium]|nr:ChaN family lipoprotein [bacterium]
MIRAAYPILLLVVLAACGCHSPKRCSLWVDVVRGEPVTFPALIEDLEQADVVFLGERHTLERHHAIQARIIDALAATDRPLVIALEQVGRHSQKYLDEYADGKLTFDQLAESMAWAKQWGNYRDYKPLLEAGRRHKARLLGLNARREVIRQMGRGGLKALPKESRAQLPEQINVEDPVYTALLKLTMGVMVAAMPDRMNHMIEAQIARDETMAETLCTFLSQPANRKTRAIVVCGAVHVGYGLGTAQRVRRRMPDLDDRIVVMSGSGDVVLSPAMAKMARDITITHSQLRFVPTRIADYLHVAALRSEPKRHEAPRERD